MPGGADRSGSDGEPGAGAGGARRSVTWATGALLLALPPPRGLRVAAAGALIEHLPERLRADLEQRFGLPSSPELERQLASFERHAATQLVAVRESDGQMIEASLLQELPAPRRRAYGELTPVTALLDTQVSAARSVLAVAALMIVLWMARAGAILNLLAVLVWWLIASVVL